MASIFTFDHDPPRVSSPWKSVQENGRRASNRRPISTGAVVEAESAEDSDPERLEAEPQEGPIEYKLHLLLRPRRTYQELSTIPNMRRSRASQSVRGEARTLRQPSLPLSSSNQSRHNRLQHLTTQLLWRLQQSSPYHTTGRGDLVVPRLPKDFEDLATLEEPGKLIPGLEESNGALYEIGVADDGTFIGLTKDEMDESMATLKVMAASLGCRVEVQRMKVVGTCEWREETAEEIGDKVGEVAGDGTSAEAGASSPSLRHADLWVAEALIMPILNGQTGRNTEDTAASVTPRRGVSSTEQLRISLTGPTTSGKTTLLGTLSNGTLDNGRGRSRINLLKHRHEVASGRTSSIAQELIGYQGQTILNYRVDNINEWLDIHDRAENGRLVFFIDSAGHPRYQRTTLRALVGWAPHWTVLCIGANDDSSLSSGTHSLSGADGTARIGVTSMDLALAHLDLSLKLEMPLAILITKTELAQRTSLRDKLNPILTKVKATGRVPKLLTSPGGAAGGADLAEVPEGDRKKVKCEVIDPITESGNPLAVVPIILTSAVSGMGIGMTHALLQSLPVPPSPTARDFTPLALNPEQPAALFHIDEVFELSLSRAKISTDQRASESAPVITGYMRFGSLAIGDKVLLGPFPAEEEDSKALIPNDHPSPGYGLSIPHPSSAEYARLSSRNALSASRIEGEWREATIVNIRELRLPVQTILAGQAGSIQIRFDEPQDDVSGSDKLHEKARASGVRIRKGQVLAMPSQHMRDTGLSLQASTGFTGSFRSPNIKSLEGNLVNAYVGMVRAAVRVLRVTHQRAVGDSRRIGSEDDDDVFGMEEHLELERGKSEADLDDECNAEYHVSLELLTNREWIELGSRVVLLEGGIKEKSGLEGYVGKVIEVSE
ncbi:GTP-binding protein [Xylariaceae sp. FL0804]|nr:GTP-binding protein [Xylariaceae sp. FL0804]